MMRIEGADIERYIVLACVAGALAACETAGSTASRPVAQPMAPASAPDLVVGKTLVYETEDGGREQSSITTIDADGKVTWESASGSTWTVIHPFAGHVQWKTPGDEGTQSFTGDSMVPLEVGRTMQISYSGQSTSEGSWSGTRNCKVESQESIGVKAGTFDTFKVVCTQGSNPSRPARTRTFYYAPEVGDSVLTVHQIHYQGRTERAELVDAGGGAES
jgi:hypothetical protein